VDLSSVFRDFTIFFSFLQRFCSLPNRFRHLNNFFVEFVGFFLVRDDISALRDITCVSQGNRPLEGSEEVSCGFTQITFSLTTALQFLAFFFAARFLRLRVRILVLEETGAASAINEVNVAINSLCICCASGAIAVGEVCEVGVFVSDSDI